MDHEFVCTETAEWKRNENRATFMDTMYVMVYDTKNSMPPGHGHYVQEDGFGRTIMFVRSDDFMNWYVRRIVCLVTVMRRYDIDPGNLGCLTPNHPLTKRLGLLHVRTAIFDDIGKTRTDPLDSVQWHCLRQTDKRNHINGPRELKGYYALVKQAPNARIFNGSEVG